MAPAPGILAALIVVACSIPATAPRAQQTDAYPSRQIALVVPFPAGGPADTIARVMGRKLHELLGQAVVVENRPGATGNIGAAYVAKAKPDGYTILLGTNNTHGGNPALYKSTGYDAVADFSPITFVASQRSGFVAFPKAPFDSLQQLVETARHKPGEVRFASAGNGSANHIAMELLQRSTQTKMTHVPYKGIAPALLDLLRGEVEVMYIGLANVMPHFKDGRLKALSVDGPTRLPELPNVPTTPELGYKGIEIGPWFGLFAPAHTPRPIVERLYEAAAKTLDDLAVRARLEGAGFQLRSERPEKFAEFVKIELDQWADRIRISGASID